MVAFGLVYSRLPPIKVITSVVTPQWVAPLDKVTFTRAVTTLRPDCGPGSLKAKMVDADHHVRIMELPPGARPPPVVGDISSTWVVPETMAPGEARYSSEVSYPCFPFYSSWPVTVELPEIQFWVKGQQRPELQSR